MERPPIPNGPERNVASAGPGSGPVGPEPTFPTRLLRLFTAPRQAFAEPRGLRFWLVPLVILFAMSLAESLLLQDLYNEWVLEAVDTNPLLSEDQRNTALEALEEQQAGGTTVGSVVQTAFGALGTAAIGAFGLGLFYLLGVNFGLAGSARYLEVVGVLGLASMLDVLRSVITLPLKLSQQTLAIHTGPAAFAPDAGALTVILGSFDVFSLYRLFLLTVGLSVVGGVQVSRTAILVAAFWVLGTGFRLAFELSPLGSMTP